VMCAAVHGMHMCSTGREIGGQLVVFHTYVGMLYMIPRHVIPRVHARSQPIDRRLAIVLRAWTICWPGHCSVRNPHARATGRASVLADPDARGTEESDGSGASGDTGWAGQQLPSLYRLIGGVCSMAGVVLWTSTPRRSGPGQFGDCLAQ
jgi:hypothetical protein